MSQLLCFDYVTCCNDNDDDTGGMNATIRDLKLKVCMSQLMCSDYVTCCNEDDDDTGGTHINIRDLKHACWPDRAAAWM
jgi:hypothetical protein